MFPSYFSHSLSLVEAANGEMMLQNSGKDNMEQMSSLMLWFLGFCFAMKQFEWKIARSKF
jgi:adenosylmethionine-8-amino-7-oxononanoate aminotransferase